MSEIDNKDVVQYYIMEEFCTPIQATPGSACDDLVARQITFEYKSDYNLITVNLGICTVIPKHLRADLLPRSSISKTGLIMCNSTGIIDSDYRDEWMIKFYDFARVYSHTNLPFKIGDRVAQFKIERKLEYTKEYITKEQLEQAKTTRDGGFGSTGK